LRLRALPSARRLTHALWYGRSVRAQLLIAFILIDLIAGAVAGAVTILQARRSTRVEIAASMELAQLLVSEAVALMQQAVPRWRCVLRALPKRRAISAPRPGSQH
jgi:two-component system sensor histidine kinase UhpB